MASTMDTSYYTYNGKQWKSELTVSDNNSFFHSVFGIKASENEAYFDRHAKFRRMRWAAFLTYFENEIMSSCLSDVLANCLSANVKYKDVCIEDKTFSIKYVSDILTAEHPVVMEEIPVLAALENLTVVVLSDSESDPVTVFKPNREILGRYSHLLEKHKEVVLGMKGNIFSRLSFIDENSIPKIDTKTNAATESEQQPENHLTTYVKRGSAGSKGVEFQVNLLMIFLLNALLKLKNWRLSTENKQAGKFDDIVLELSDKSAILLQAKYKESRTITFDQLISVNSKNDDFSLPKYFFSYQEIKNKFLIKAVIICTNTKVDKKSLKCLNRQVVSSDSMLHYKDDNCTFFTFNDKIFSDLRKNVKTYFDNNLQGKNIDEKIISDENIKDFLNNLQLYCNYPSDNNLQTIVERILFRMKYFNNLWGRVSFQDLYNKVMEWFRHPLGEYLTEDRTQSIFCEIRSDKYCETLEHYNVLFEHNNFSFTDLKKLFHIVAEDGYLLNTIKIYRALQNIKSKILYVNPEDNINVQKQIINAFELPSYKYLIIIYSKLIEKSLKTEVYDQLGKILENHKGKKLILVSGSDENLAQFKLSNDNCTIIKGSVTFADLTEDSQERLLKKKSIVFQGYEISLEQLLSDNKIEACQKSLYPEIMEMLIRDEKIKVGTEVQPLGGSISRYYVDRQFMRRVKTRNETFSVETIYECNEKVMIISDTAGTGKSTILTKLAMTIKNLYPHLWVIKIELNDYTGILKELLKIGRKVMHITELLDYNDSTKITSQFEKLVFSMRENVVLMLDGIDEISPDYTGLIVNLIVQCQKAHNFAKIFVTTRPHMTQELEAKLQVKPFILQSFSRQNQIDFLTNYWMLNVKLDNINKIKCEHYAEALINKMSSWMELNKHRKNNFAAIPLQVRMLAEIFQGNNDLDELTRWEGCTEYLLSNREEPKLPEKMNITKMYQIFVEKKRDVFIDKGNPSGKVAANQALTSQFDECLNFHRSLALKYILETNCQLFSCYQICGKNIELNALKVGIVQKIDDRYYFVHRTFAEFFVAESLLRELELENQNVLFQKFLIEEILLNPEYNVIRSFFNSCLHNVIESLPSNVLANYQFLIYEIDLCRKQKFNLIHQMAAEGCESIIQLLFKCMDFNGKEGNGTNRPSIYKTNFSVKAQNKVVGKVFSNTQIFVQRARVNIKDEKGKTPLHYATQNGHLETVKFLIKEGANINVRDFGDCSPLHMAVKHNHFEVATFLIEQGADIKARGRVGHTVFYESIMENNISIASYILNTHLYKDGDYTKDTMIPYAAAYLGQLHILGKLLEQGVDINSRIRNEESLIFGATRGRQLSTIQYLVQNGADVNSRDEDGNTPLCLAASKGYFETVKLLVDSGVEINAANNEGRTALHIAASWGQLETAEFLVNYGADVNKGDSDGYTVLHLAAEEGLLDIIKFFVDRGADVNIRGHDNRTALFLAALQGETDTVKLLVERGTNINYRDSDGSTALFLAAENGELDTVKYLVECGAGVNIKDNEGHTVLHLAVLAFRHLDTLKLLVECGADVNIRDNDGRTVLFAATEEGNLDAIQILVEAGANVNARDDDGLTALHLAAIRDQPEIIRSIVECGAELNAKSHDGWAPLHLATVRGQLDTIKLLVDDGADINIKCKDGRTALFLAVKEGHIDIIKFFVLEIDMDINITNNVDRTALHYAALAGKSDVVKCLIECGANVSIKDSYGNTATMLAKKNGHMHLLMYLETKSAKRIWTQLCFCCPKT